MGGIATGGDSNSARKSYARGNRSTSVGKSERFSQNITFNNEDLEGVTCPHDDALFEGATVIPEGTTELPVTLGTYPASVVIMTSFLLVKAHMPCNAIYGRPLLNAARAVVSTYHQVLKIGGGMDFEEKHKLVACLSENINVFAWGPQDIKEISPMIAQHRVAISLGTKPIKQKKRQFTPE
ncbi:Ribonuclease H [Abeliophyllum distichum]|uniref:Ribonuclease H n=1 Tax=Abeliophyllum distichum TaxID=126358 RepID=A0ABD1VYK8_9LAMI